MTPNPKPIELSSQRECITLQNRKVQKESWLQVELDLGVKCKQDNFSVSVLLSAVLDHSQAPLEASVSSLLPSLGGGVGDPTAPAAQPETTLLQQFNLPAGT